jgi:hypothetical protein
LIVRNADSAAKTAQIEVVAINVFSAEHAAEKQPSALLSSQKKRLPTSECNLILHGGEAVLSSDSAAGARHRYRTDRENPSGLRFSRDLFCLTSRFTGTNSPTSRPKSMKPPFIHIFTNKHGKAASGIRNLGRVRRDALRQKLRSADLDG